MPGMAVQVVGMAWYRREDWKKLKALFTDAHKLHRTYDEWLKAAETGVKTLTAQGHIVEKVHIDPDEFAGWCAMRGLNIDAKARTQFANEFVYRKYQNRG